MRDRLFDLDEIKAELDEYGFAVLQPQVVDRPGQKPGD